MHHIIVYIPLTASSTDESSPSDNTGAVVGGVVVLVAVVVTGVVIVTYLVLRYKRGGKMLVCEVLAAILFAMGLAFKFGPNKSVSV